MSTFKERAEALQAEAERLSAKALLSEHDQHTLLDAGEELTSKITEALATNIKKADNIEIKTDKGTISGSAWPVAFIVLVIAVAAVLWKML